MEKETKSVNVMEDLVDFEAFVRKKIHEVLAQLQSLQANVYWLLDQVGSPEQELDPDEGQ